MNRVKHNSDIGSRRKNPHELIAFFMLLDLRDFLFGKAICLSDTL